MLFNTLQFILFFIIVTITYFNINHKYRWMLLLFASCYFYMVFVPVYILILGFTIVIDYFAGIFIEKTKGKKRVLYLIYSLIANIGVLAVFKYYNFINTNLTELLGVFSIKNPVPFLSILLPIGLSFHTFQAMSYTIEVYRGNQKAERHFGIYALYVMFYPQLVAGPIERPQNLLPQFYAKHEYDFERIKSGIMQMAWGLFKKVVIADRLAMAVDYSYTNAASQNGLSLLFATMFYSFQIYCDFSGYSDIAIGAARVMGFKLMDNFKTPYLSKTIAEFWKRWHISLSTWFKDYLYISLGGNRVALPRMYLNLFLVFLISGVWHGASWMFVIWGALHGIYLIIGKEKDKFIKRLSIKKKLPDVVNKSIQIFLTFALVTFAWIFFRATTLTQAIDVIKKIFAISIHDQLQTPLNSYEIMFSVLLIALLMVKEKYIVEINTRSTFRFSYILTLLVFSIYIFGIFNHNQFIYFQF